MNGLQISAIKKINDEMQKNPDDLYTEIIGQYVIDRCMVEADAEMVAAEGKTLEGAMKKVHNSAAKKKHGNVAVLSDAEVFKIIDKYFGFRIDKAAQVKAMNGVGAEPVPAPVPKSALDLADFL